MRFSVVIPAYNATDTLRQTVESVMAQTCTDYEIIIVDDGSTDDTRALSQQLAGENPRVHVVTKPNGGTASAYNTGVATAQGDYIVILSADDLLLPTHLADLDKRIADNPNFEIFFNNGFYLYDDTSRKVVYDGEDLNFNHELPLAHVVQWCPFGVGASYDKRVFDRIGGYTLGIYGEDWDFWLRAMSTGSRVFYCATPTAEHRVSATQKTADLTKVYESDIKILKNINDNFEVDNQIRQVISATIANRVDCIAQIKEGAHHNPIAQKKPKDSFISSIKRMLS